MARNVTVTFADGSSHVYANAPDNITPGMVAARASKDFGKQISNIDGGRTTQPTRNAPAVPVQTRRQAVQAVARQPVQPPQTSVGGAIWRGLQDAIPGVNYLQAAGNELGSHLGLNSTNMSFADRVRAYKAMRDTAEAADREQHPIAHYGAEIGGALAGGVGLSTAARFGAARLAGSAIPAAARVGNVLQRAVTLNKGARLANVGKVAAGGATGGAIYGAGDSNPEDIGTGAVHGAEAGAVGALALGAGGKLVQGAAKLVRGVRRPFSGNVDRAVREVIREPAAAVQARQADLAARTGAAVPVVAALKDADYKSVTNKVLKNSPEATEIAKAKTGDYVRGFMDRMLGHVNNAGKMGDAQVVQGVGDLAQLRKETADSIMAPIADRKLDMTQLPLDDLERQVTKQAGGRIVGLGPRINAALKDITPDDLADGTTPQNLADAKKLMQQFGLSTPVKATVRELDGLRRTLGSMASSSAASNPVNAKAFGNAAKTIGDFVGEAHPEYKQMLDTYASHSRMLEGFDTASSGKRVADVPDDQLRANLSTPEGRIGMKAGELFRLRGFASSKPTAAMNLARDLGAQGDLTRAASLDPAAARPGSVTENIGEAPAAKLADTSQAETTVLNRMLDTSKVNAMAQTEEGALSPEELAYGALLGHALPSTKARFIAGLMDKLPKGFNPKVASNMADMLYSNDPAQTAKVFNALSKVGLDEKAVNGIVSASSSIPGGFAAGELASGQPNEEANPADAPPPIAKLDLGGGDGAFDPSGPIPTLDLSGAPDAPAAAEPAADPATPQMTDPASPDTGPDADYDPERPYGRQVVERIYPQARITDDVRAPGSKLALENPDSWHVKSQNAVDVEPIHGMTFEQYVQGFKDHGHHILEAIDEVKHPSKHATGPHWHVAVI